MKVAPKYSVMLDQHGVQYLRVGGTASVVQLILNSGSCVDLIAMDNKTVHSRDLRPVPSANLLDTAKQLYRPLSSSVQVSARAQEVLKQILNDKEILAMARVAVAAKNTTAAAAPAPAAKRPVLVKGNKGAKKAAAPAKAATKGKKTDSAADGRSLDNVGIRALVKQNPSREGTFCFAQVEAAITSKTVAEAQTKLDKSGLNPNGRRIEIAWLVKKGFIKTL